MGGGLLGFLPPPSFPGGLGKCQIPPLRVSHTLIPPSRPLETHHSTPLADRSPLHSWQPRSGQGSGRRARPRPGCPTGAPDPGGGSRFPFPSPPGPARPRRCPRRAEPSSPLGCAHGPFRLGRIALPSSARSWGSFYITQS